ncbi:MAG: ABC transporter permease [Chloroflexi bacterium]|nr:ABC transporter permease [Chloroflexota bacterium]
MERSGASQASIQAFELRPRASRWRGLSQFVRRKPLGAAGAAVLTLLVLVAVFAPLVAPYDPYDMHYENAFNPPGLGFLLGTDNFGRDLFSRIMWGARISLYVGVISVAFGTTLGAVLGLISGYWGGSTDIVLQRIVDVLLAFPMLILAMAVMAALGASLNNVIIAVGVVLIPQAARVVRSSTLSIKENDYVLAARAIGCTAWRILFIHVLPQCLAPYIIVATAALGWAILTEATLSFLGFGTPPPIPSWGAMLSGGAQVFMEKAPWMAIFPGVAVTLAVFSVNLLGDGLRDVLDPRLRQG